MAQMPALGSPTSFFNEIVTGRTVVTTSGTAVQLGTEPCNAVIIQCLKANTGNIMVGDSSVDITDGSEDGIETSSLELERSILVAEPTKFQDGGERNRR